jgi:hypothetical protein
LPSVQILSVKNSLPDEKAVLPPPQSMTQARIQSALCFGRPGASLYGGEYLWSKVLGRYRRYIVDLQLFKALHLPLQIGWCPLHC